MLNEVHNKKWSWQKTIIKFTYQISSVISLNRTISIQIQVSYFVKYTLICYNVFFLINDKLFCIKKPNRILLFLLILIGNKKKTLQEKGKEY